MLSSSYHSTFGLVTHEIHQEVSSQSSVAHRQWDHQEYDGWLRHVIGGPHFLLLLAPCWLALFTIGKHRKIHKFSTEKKNCSIKSGDLLQAIALDGLRLLAVSRTSVGEVYTQFSVFCI